MKLKLRVPMLIEALMIIALPLFVSAAPVTLAIVADLPKNVFESQVATLIQKEFAGCSQCTYINATPYSADGTAEITQSNKIIEGLNAQAGKFQILYFHWNEKLNAQNKNLVEFVQKQTEQNILVVASAGQPKPQESSGMLSKTLFGSINKVIIIGEIGEKDRLIGQSYYGPEMLTALRAPKDLLGQGFSPLVFATRLTKNYGRQKDWLAYLQMKKSKHKRIWLELGDIFW